MKTVWNNSNKWVYIRTHCIKPQGIIEAKLIELDDLEGAIELIPELEIINIDKVDNCDKAIKKRLKEFKKRF